MTRFNKSDSEPSPHELANVSPADLPESTLRERAELAANISAPRWPENITNFSTEAIRPLLHDLRVHQIELEMQNEELRRTQQELELSRARYFELYDLAPVGYCTLSLAGLILEANFTSASLLGVGRSSLLRQPLSRFIHAEDSDLFYLMCIQLRKTEQRKTCELRMLRPDGSSFWAHLTAIVAQESVGTGPGNIDSNASEPNATAPPATLVFRVVLKDISERKLLESQKERERNDLETLAAALKMTEQITKESLLRLSTMVDQLPAGAVFIDGENLRFNSTAQQILGYTNEEIATRTDWFEKVFPMRSAEARAVYERDRASGFSHSSEICITRKDGAQRWLIASGFVDVKSEIWIFHDTTARHQAEEDLRHREAELARIARLCTLGEMVAEIAHEIHQPLYAISNFAGACREKLASQPPHPVDQLTHWLRSIQDQSEHAATIIRRLRTLASPSPPQIMALEFAEVAQETMEMLAFDARKAGIQTNIKLPENLPRAFADRVQLQQVLINLVKNAYEAFAPTTTERRVDISLLVQANHLEVIVADSGPGFSETSSQHMFEPFFTTKSRGLGMGLPISRSLVTAQGGKLWANHAATRGAEVHFTIPRVPVELGR